jgi:hypothetical protein
MYDYNSSRRETGACRQKCPGGKKCCSTNSPHFYHSCKDPWCDCRRQYLPFPDSFAPPPRKAAPLPVGGHIDLLKLLRHIRATSRRANAHSTHQDGLHGLQAHVRVRA